MSSHHLAVKLGVEKDGETIFRRLSSSLLGASALSSVKREALALFRSEFSDGQDSTECNLEVSSLYYYDHEGDKILILSDKDFFNTVKEYTAAGKTSLKFIAKITSKTAAPSPSAKSAPGPREMPPVPKHVLDACANAGGNLQNCGDDDFILKCTFGDAAYKVLHEWVATLDEEDPHAIRTMLGSNVEATNVNSSVATQTTGHSTQTVTAASSDQNEPRNVIEALGDLVSIAAASVEAAVNNDVSTSKDFAKKQLRAVKRASKDGLKAVKNVTRDSFRAAKQASRCAAQTVAAAVTVPSAAESSVVCDDGSSVPQNSRPFIHGRHTCDSCLATPIVGKRYNAINLTDYDLCETCFSNYSGTENQFVPVVLERDITFQDRWTQKRAIHVQRRLAAQRNKFPTVSAETSCPIHDPEDHVLQVAIRRSLEDAAKKEDSKNEGKTVSSEIFESGLHVDESVKKATAAPEGFVAGKGNTDCYEEEHVAEPVKVETVEESLFNCTEEEYVVETVDESDPNCTEEEYVVEPVKVETIEESDNDNELSPSADRNVSFASEASGSGAVAAFVGQTLDRMSEAIDSLNEQLSDGKNEEDSADYDDDDASRSTCNIVEGEDDIDSQDSWSVVLKEFEGGDADREMARATEAIGSALFNSDLRSSEIVSTMSGHTLGGSSSSSASSSSSSSSGSIISTVTSVPTVVNSMAPAADNITEFQRNRWAVQLEQLHEMGFTDDARCIRAIESLAAADMGIDSYVSVQHIVEKLMSNL